MKEEEFLTEAIDKIIKELERMSKEIETMKNDIDKLIENN